MSIADVMTGLKDLRDFIEEGLTNLHARIVGLEAHMNSRFDGVEVRLTSVEGRLTSVEARVSGLERRVESGFTEMREEFGEVHKRLEMVERR